MAEIMIADRVMETSAATGSGNLALAGAVTGYMSFGDSPLSSADVYFPYVIEGVDGACVGQMEWGIGRIDAGTLERTQVSSHAEAVSLLAGAKRIFCGITQEYLSSLFPPSKALNETGLDAACSASGQTVDATPVVLQGNQAAFASEFDGAAAETFNMNSGTSVKVLRLTVTAFDSSADDAAAWDVEAVAIWNGATASLVGTPTVTEIASDVGATAWQVAVGVSGENVTITVTGEAGKFIDWNARGFLG